MYIKLLVEDIHVFGKPVKDFPAGIGPAFDTLVTMLPKGDTRPFYGVSECTQAGITYMAAALETYSGEAATYDCERYTISKGEYLFIPVNDWRDKISSIQSVFQKLLENDLADRQKPAIEVYINDEEMHCMVKIDPLKQLQTELQAVTNAFMETLSSFPEQDINIITRQGAWSAAQVVEHVTLSDKGMARIFRGKVQKTERDPAANVLDIKQDFLDFDTKNESPEFVRPANKIYNKAQLLSSFSQSREKLQQIISEVDLALLYADFPFPGPDGMSGLELLSFIVYHTARHHHQLQMIKESLSQPASV